MKRAFSLLALSLISAFAFSQVRTITSMPLSVKQAGIYTAGPAGNVTLGGGQVIKGRLNYQDAIDGKVASSTLVFISMSISQIDNQDSGTGVFYWGEVSTMPANAESGSYPKEFYIIYAAAPINGYRRFQHHAFYGTYLKTIEATYTDPNTGVKKTRSVPLFQAVYAGFDS